MKYFFIFILNFLLFSCEIFEEFEKYQEIKKHKNLVYLKNNKKSYIINDYF